MKSLLVTVVALQLCFLASAQEVAKKKEVGIVFSSFDNFGATFRVGTSHSLWRYSAVLLSGTNTKNTNTNSQNNTSSFGSTLSFGKELRKGISEKFYLRYGADVSAGYLSSKNELLYPSTSEFSKSTTNGYHVGFNLVAGANYSLSENFLLGIELLPYARYYDAKTKTTSSGSDPATSDYHSFNFGLSSSSVMLSLVYRW